MNFLFDWKGFVRETSAWGGGVRLKGAHGGRAGERVALGLTGHGLDLTPDVVASLGGHVPHAPPHSERPAQPLPGRAPTAIYCSVFSRVQ